MQFEAVVETHSSRLYRLAYLYLHDSQSAEDAVQEAFIKYLHEKTSVHHTGAWLNRVVRNICLNEIRKRSRVQQVDPLQMPDEATESFDTEVTVKLRMSEVLLLLPLAYRDILVWRYYLQVPDEDLAEQLGITPSGVRSRLSRARKAIAQLLKEDEV